MIENKELFMQNLEKLHELVNRGQNADPKEFNMLARSLIWDVQSSFTIPLPSEQMELFKILATSDIGGEYWKGYSDAITAFLLPLMRTGFQETNRQQRSIHPATDIKVDPAVSTDSPVERLQVPDGSHPFTVILD